MSTPEVFFRETIDLGRYSNSVSRKFVSTYNDIIVASAKAYISALNRLIFKKTKSIKENAASLKIEGV